MNTPSGSSEFKRPLSPACKVCGLTAEGTHFGVVACRPCAAFFRRFVVLNLIYECVEDPVKCSLDKNRRSACRQCRYEKCLRVGMSRTAVQPGSNGNLGMNYNRKDLKSQESEEDVQVLSICQPSTSLMRTEDDFFKKSVLSEIKYENLEKMMHEIFASDIPSTRHGYFASLSPLYQIVEGLKLIRKSQKKENILFENRLSMETLIPHWRAQAKNIATLSMHSMAFRNIPLTEKSKIYKAIWQSIYRLERIQMSTEIFGGKCVSEKKLAISCERAIQLDALFFDIEGVAQNNLRISLQDYKLFAERCVEEVAKPLSRLYLSTEEVAFLILNFVFHNEESIKGESLSVCNVFRDQVSNDLHKYYTKNNVANYASRILKIMNIVGAMKKIHYDDLGGKFIQNAKRGLKSNK